jgi:hypothetical protein
MAQIVGIALSRGADARERPIAPEAPISKAKPAPNPPAAFKIVRLEIRALSSFGSMLCPFRKLPGAEEKDAAATKSNFAVAEQPSPWIFFKLAAGHFRTGDTRAISLCPETITLHDGHCSGSQGLTGKKF